jgi:hypothetical protein
MVSAPLSTLHVHLLVLSVLATARAAGVTTLSTPLQHEAIVDSRGDLVDARAAAVSPTSPIEEWQPKFVFVTASDKAYAAQRKSTVANAHSCGIFDRVIEHDERSIQDVPGYAEYMLPLLRAPNRGWGYWVFKPLIALEAFSAMAEGDVLVYHDAGARVDCRTEARRGVLRDWAALLEPSGGKDALAFQMHYRECNWNKGDTLAFLGVLDNEGVTMTGQFHATFWLLRKSPASEALLRQWLAVFAHPHIVNDAPSVVQLRTCPSFHDHRHDQAVWSVLRKLHPGTAVLPDPQYSHDSPLQSRHLQPAPR